MLASLSIKNFALIDNLHVNFEEGFSIITGETGAGKSILLGGLALILGKRADLSSLKIREKKCIIEGEFLISKYNLQDLFVEHNLDFEERTIIRREILPNGKSRAFINDTPTTLTSLAALAEKIIDVHSQHQTLELADINYQFLIIDSLADNAQYLKSFKEGLNIYRRLNNELKALLNRQQEETNQYEYNAYLLKELNDANFKVDEQSVLEETLEKLNHIEEIKLYLTEAKQLFEQEELGISDQINKYAGILAKLSKFSNEYQELSDRLHSIKIEIDDITQDLDASNENIEYSPAEIEKYNNRLQLIYDLQKKHKVSNIEELLDKQQKLIIKVSSVENASEIIAAKEKEIAELENRLDLLSITLRKNRLAAIPILVKQLETLLKELEMPKTTFKINLLKTEDFNIHGKDELEFLISTNKGSSFESLKKIASGGEMSRIMLAVKSILCNYSNLPTIIFDEIDTGVSGEVSNRIATVMSAMSKQMQVIAITHLPQIAAKGTHHFKVYKEEINNRTVTNIKLLKGSDRVSELAEMLSGKEIIDSAIVHAKQLLNQ